MSKKLVAYFSASGSTAKLADNLAAAAGADLYEIKPAVPYVKGDLNWMDKKSRSTVEMQDKNCRPALADSSAPIAEADVIFLGFPIWWYREPSIIDSFLDAYDFSGKTIVPFFTSGGSQLGEGQERIQSLAAGAKVMNGKRFSARANAMYKISPTLTARFSIAPTFSFENRPSTDGAFFSGGGLLANANLVPPIINWENPDGTMPVNINTPGVTQVETPNWVRSIKDTKNQRTIKRLLANASLEYAPIEGLLVKTSVSTDLGSEFHTYFQPSTAGRAFAAAANSINAYLSDANNRYYSWLWENTATYGKTIGAHHFEVLGGYTIQKFRSDYTGISGSNYADDRIQTINAALVKNNPSQDIQEWSMMSFLGRVNYDLMGRYLLSASIRRDGSSRFGSNNKWGNFPAVSLGWLVNEETFMKSVDWLSMFKVRASYGLIGNNNIGNYTQYNVISNSNTVFGSTTSSGIRVTNLGNTELGWERTAEFDFGIDLSFLNNRITFTYDYYNKTTRDLLYSLSVPRESGFSNFMGNVGKLRFWGHEFSVVSHNLTGEFKWDTNFNLSFSDNKVLELSGLSDQLIAWTGIISTITEVGGRIGQFYGMVQDGVYRDQNDYNNSPKAVDSEVGTIKFRDINGDGQITYDDVNGDKTIIGNPFPDFIFGITNNFYYKNFDQQLVVQVGNVISSTPDT